MNSAIVIALVCLASAVSGASLGRIAQNVHSDSLFFNAGLDSAPGLPEPKEFQLRRNTIPVGKKSKFNNSFACHRSVGIYVQVMTIYTWMVYSKCA